ncbi:protein FAM83G-like [Parambassis ranga]|uniref:Protein FAM83G-like n=1 Tax=Parambassis ranga TaxID=210632 RepID=A0A6P7ING5_9TELE|nr:protein FAM83G-like [Parambassis ranga]
MALSQLQCLDNNHVNPRTHESKPEFLYCEDQRLALEALLRDGREAFHKYLEARGLRGFLSDPELEALTGTAEPYDTDAELFEGHAEDDRTPLSLHYWPELSDTSIPQMDLGWPDCDAYRGVTRTTVYTQPPLDGQAHVKEVVRKMIAQAQKVVAVVMDVFTDVDIFRDLLDAGFKRRISVYILLERTTLPHFLSMCRRANMHAGHLKHLRVRCTEGSEFYTRSCTKVRGRMGHRFMFIDGDKAVSGSYSFTWMSSRLDRNLITVVTGQAVEGFDRLYRTLYATSGFVDLRPVALEPEPEVEHLPQTVSVAPPSAAVARKLYNPKYALVAGSNPSPTASVGRDKKPQTSDVKTNNRRRRANKEAVQEAPPLHPGLLNLEKACLITYLPTWPEPDPPSDVIGFINIRDTSKPTPVHLQRSEMFETSQAIRFSSPIMKPQEVLPEAAKPRQLTAKHDKAKTPQQPAANKTEDQRQPEPEKDSTSKTESKLESNMAARRDARQHTPQIHTAQLTTDTLRQSSCRETEDKGQNSSGSDCLCSTHTSELKDKPVVSHTQQVGPTTVSPALLSENNQITAECSETPPHVALNPPSSSPPVPKPRTIQLLIKDSGDEQKICILRKSGVSAGMLAVPPSSEKDAESVTKLQNDPKPKETKSEEADGHQDGGEETRSDVCSVPTAASTVNNQEITPKDGDETVTSAACEMDILASEKTHQARAQEPQRISYSEPTAQEVSETASTHSPVSPSHGAVDTHIQPPLNSAPPKAQLCTHTRKKSLRLHFSDTHLSDLRSTTPERETRSLSCLARPPTPDGLSPRTPTPDSRMATPDLRTPTPDGYVSTREDSGLSTTSEEYYECSDSPLHDSVFDHVDYHHVRTMEEPVPDAAEKVKTREEEKRKQSLTDSEKADTDSPLPKNQSAAGVGGTAGESTSEGAEPKLLSPIKGSEVPPDTRVSSEAENQAAQRPSSTETGRETEKTPQCLQQQDGGCVSSSRPPRCPRPFFASQVLGPRPWGGRQLTEVKVLPGGLQDNTSSSRRPAAVGSASGGRKQVSQTPQSLLPRQPAAAQSRAGAGQYSKPPTSFQHTRSSRQLSPQNQAGTGQEALGKDEGRAPFGFTFSRLYSLKGLKDTMNKLPAQSKRSSSGSAGRKTSM